MRWWPFGRRKPRHVGPATVDWKPGDMAECVDDQWRERSGLEPKIGSRHMVRHVRYAVADGGKHQTFFLFLVGYAFEAFDHRAFRKITLTDTGADRRVTKKVPCTKERTDA